jgi:hypothetical protein
VVEICAVFLLLLGGLLAIPCMCFQRACDFYRFFLLLLRLLCFGPRAREMDTGGLFFFFFFMLEIAGSCHVDLGGGPFFGFGFGFGIKFGGGYLNF